MTYVNETDIRDASARLIATKVQYVQVLRTQSTNILVHGLYMCSTMCHCIGTEELTWYIAKTNGNPLPVE